MDLVGGQVDEERLYITALLERIQAVQQRCWHVDLPVKPAETL